MLSGLMLKSFYQIIKPFEQFCDFKMMIDLPDDILDDAKLEQLGTEVTQYRMDSIWYHLQQMKNLSGENFRCHLLSKVARLTLITPHSNVARLILITPHSNAGIERLYSPVNKNKEKSLRHRRISFIHSSSKTGQSGVLHQMS